jgi:signal transduction histidine kinase
MQAARTLLDRIRDLPQDLRDRLFAGAILVAMLAELAAYDLEANDVAPTLALIAAYGVALSLRSRAPVAVFLTLCGLYVASDLVGFFLNDAFTPFVGVVATSWAVGAVVEPPRLWRVAVPLASVGIFGVVLAGSPDATSVPSNVLFSIPLVLILPIVGARTVRSRTHLAAALAEQTQRLEAQREARARAAVAGERRRIAHELHDMVAHAVSEMVVQAGAARRAVAAAGPSDDAREAIAGIEATGRDALGEMRRLLGVLRRGDESLALAPQPTLARVDGLVASMRGQGLAVELSVEGDAVLLPPGLDLTAYRVVQEALANLVAAGIAAPTHVLVRYGRRTLDLEVVDEGPAEGRVGASEGSDSELLGMRERVALFGGVVQAGPRREGGYAVRARLPLEGPA